MRILSVTYHRWPLVQQFLDRLSELTGEFSVLHVWDNGSSPEMVEKLKEYERQHSWLNVTYNAENVGKARAGNELFRSTFDLGEMEETVCLCDPDIVIEAGVLTRLKDMVTAFRRPCIIAPNYTAKKTAHTWDRLKDRRQISIDGTDVVVSKHGQGVAGGCLVMKNRVFHFAGGYDSNRGIYGGNEQSLYKRFAEGEGSIFVVPGLQVRHLPEPDEGYMRWKAACQNLIRSRGSSGLRMGYYEMSDPDLVEKSIPKDGTYSFVPVLAEVCRKLRPRKVLEWGPSWSTDLIVSICPQAKVFSIEHSRQWFEYHDSRFSGNENVVVAFRPHGVAGGGSGGYVAWPLLCLMCEGKRNYRQYDLIFVDGRARLDCLVLATQLVRPKGVVMLHDSDREMYQKAFRLFPHVRNLEEQRTALLSLSSLEDYECE